MSKFTETLQAYDYRLPKELIAQAPATPRDSSRLLVYNRNSGKTVWTHFREIGKYLPKNCILVLNHTKVIPARLPCIRQDGKTVQILCTGITDSFLSALSSKRLRVGDILSIAPGVTCRVSEQKVGGAYLLTPSFPPEQWITLCEQYGTTPLPPYIDHSPLTPEVLKERYQTVFAKHAGSIAAPTASLHFTEALLTTLQAQGIRLASVTLHVNRGTFARVTETQWKTKTLHQEWFEVPKETAEMLQEAKTEGKPIIAVGTTVVRTLESAFDAQGHLLQNSGATTLFIQENYAFHMVNGMITNFHVPRSSLLMLVSALVGRETLLDLYQQAIDRKLRFFSFGDAMLIL